MPATTTLLGLVTPTQGTLSGTWGDTVNYGITDYVDISVAGTLTLTGDGAVTLANTTGSSSGNSITSTLAGAGTVTAQFSAVRVSGTTTTKVVTGPSYSKTYLLDNASSYAVTFKASGQTGVSISPNEKVYVYYNATDYVKVGGGGITYGAVKTTTYTAVSNDGVQTNTTGGAFTVNLPATPLTGTQVFIVDSAGTWGTNNLTIGRNGSTIAGSATDLVCDINSVSIQCIYDGTTWNIFAQIGANNTAVLTQTNTVTGITNKTFVAPVLGAATATSLQGIIGNVTPAAGAFTTVDASGAVTLSGGTANGVTYLNGSKVLTSGSALVFDGATLGVGVTPSSWSLLTGLQVKNASLGAYLNRAYVIANAYYNGGFKYIASDFSSNYTQSGGIHSWFTAPSGTAGNAVTFTETMSINVNGGLTTLNTIGVGNATPSTSGAGITFPATQSASTDANTLDDYEEGTWTPTMTATSGTITLNGTYTSGKYTKVGRLVVCTASIYVGSVSSPTGNAFIGSLPFTIAAPSSSASGWYNGLTSSANNALIFRADNTSTDVMIQGFASGAVVAAAPWFRAAVEMNVVITYFV